MPVVALGPLLRQPDAPAEIDLRVGDGPAHALLAVVARRRDDDDARRDRAVDRRLDDRGLTLVATGSC